MTSAERMAKIEKMVKDLTLIQARTVEVDDTIAQANQINAAPSGPDLARVVLPIVSELTACIREVAEICKNVAYA